MFDWTRFYEAKFGLRFRVNELVYRFFDYICLLRFKTILGIGSGRAIVENIVARGRYVVASDVNAKLLRIAKEHHPRISGFVVCSAKNLPFKPHSFQCVYSQGLLEHFEKEDIKIMLFESATVGDNIVFSVPLDTYRTQEEMVWFPRSIKEWENLVKICLGNCSKIRYPNLQEAVFLAKAKMKCHHLSLPLTKYLQFNMAGICGFGVGTVIYFVISSLGSLAWFIASFVGGLFHFMLTYVFWGKKRHSREGSSL